MPHITDPAIAEEADAFVRQEGQHSMAHRQHAKGLIRAYPALKETLDKVIESYDDLTAGTPLKYRLAYTADLEATFTPVFKLMLDHDDTLFAPGDDRVASLFLWHFVEEVEHRSSALTIYDAVVDDPWYRMRVAPSIFKHVMGIIRMASEDFNKYVPLSERKVDAMSTFRIARRKKALLQRLPFTDATYDGPFANAFRHLPLLEQLVAMTGIVRSQIPPGHDPPTHEKNSPNWRRNGSIGTTPATTSRSGTRRTTTSRRTTARKLMSDLCTPTFADLAERLGGFSCDTAGGLVEFRNPLGGLENWTLPVLELTVIVGAVLALGYAIVRFRRHNDPTNLVLWFGAIAYLLIIEPPLYFPGGVRHRRARRHDVRAQRVHGRFPLGAGCLSTSSRSTR